MKKIVYTAAFGQISHHKGSIFSTALSAPKNYDGDVCPLFYPTSKLLFFWKSHTKRFENGSLTIADMHRAWNSYQSHYTAILDERKDSIERWLDEQENIITLLCYESVDAQFPYNVCHRNIAGQWLEKWFDFIHLADTSEVYDASEVTDKVKTHVKRKGKTFKTIEEGLAILEKMGIKAHVTPIQDEPDFFCFSYRVCLDGFTSQDLGLWSRTGLFSIISQLIDPDSPDKWLKASGLLTRDEFKLLRQKTKNARSLSPEIPKMSA